ncbi:tetratricopeptide repeat protein [Sphingopyxis sp. PET50]|uniref:tetratricopeptide repeat protein n=1 Tax=Sphingopyxis sp. PET50 TaxID=2976533 RepID=UPI0028AC1983|nr:tetratricopeptide repeat protein [Sphingopyxis sp. PET50]
MSESNKMSGGMTGINRAVLIAAFVLLAGAVGYAIWRDSAAGGAVSTVPETAAPVDALAALEARTKAEPDNAEAWKALGEARFDLEDFPGAVAAYDRAAALSPRSAGLWSALGEARDLCEQG